MHVGMNRLALQRDVSGMRVPHARGDEPSTYRARSTGNRSSPCTWG